MGDRNEGRLVQLASMIDTAMTAGRKRPGFVEILTVATHSHQRTARSSLGTVKPHPRPHSGDLLPSSTLIGTMCPLCQRMVVT